MMTEGVRGVFKVGFRPGVQGGIKEAAACGAGMSRGTLPSLPQTLFPSNPVVFLWRCSPGHAGPFCVHAPAGGPCDLDHWLAQEKMSMEGGLPHAGTNITSRTFSPKAPSQWEKDPVSLARLFSSIRPLPLVLRKALTLPEGS